MIETKSFSKSYIADGVQTQWEFPYPYISGDDILLFQVIDGVKTPINKVYYNFDPETNLITYPESGNPVASGTVLVIERSTPITQLEDSTVGNFKSNDVERIADKLTMIAQETSGTIASLSQAGVIQIASQEEVNEGTNSNKAVVPLTLATKMANDISSHNNSNTAHSDIRNDYMQKAGGEFTGDVTFPTDGTTYSRIKFNSNSAGTKYVVIKSKSPGWDTTGRLEILDNYGYGLLLKDESLYYVYAGYGNYPIISTREVNSSLSDSSIFPVQNKVVTAALNEKMPLTGGTFTGDITMASGKKINFQQSNISENNAGNIIIGGGNGNGLVVTKNGSGAALFYNNGSDYTEVVTRNDVKNTYSSIGTDPVTGTAVASAVSPLQSQIDALAAASDVVDVVADYTALSNYDTSKLTDNDLIKVLIDSTHSDATTYYRWSTSSSAFSYVGAEGSSYTKGEADNKFLTQTDAASTYETQSAATTALAAKASNADGTTITDSGSAISAVAVKEQRDSVAIKQWVGTKAQYEAIVSKDPNTLYVITDDEDSSALTVDSALSDNSTNPVQNRIIKAALDGKQPALPAGTTGYYLKKTTNGVEWAEVDAQKSRLHYYIAGFSASDYVQVNYIPSGTIASMSIQICGLTGLYQQNAWRCMVGQTAVNRSTPQLAINSENQINISLPISSSEWAPSATYSVTLTTNYFPARMLGMKIDYASQQLKRQYTYDNIFWRDLGTPVEQSSVYWGENILLGCDVVGHNLWDGVIDLATLLINVNGDTVFDGKTAVAGVDFTIVGTPTIQEILV